MFTRGDVVRKLREQRGWTQVELAKRSHLNKATIVKVEEDDPTVRLDTVQQVAHGLGVALEDLDSVTSPVTGASQKIAIPTGALSVRGQESVTVADTAKIRLVQLAASLDEAEAAIALKQLKDWLGARWAGQTPSKK